MFNGHFSREGWKTVRMGMTSWNMTARLVVILLAMTIPALLVAAFVHGLF